MFGYNKKLQKLKLSSKNIHVDLSCIKHTHIKQKKMIICQVERIKSSRNKNMFMFIKSWNEE